MIELNTLFFYVVLPLWAVAVTINLWASYKRERITGDFNRWSWYHFIKSVSQVVTIILGIAVGFLGAEVVRQW